MSAAVPVSVVIISYNAAATIERTLRSVSTLTNDVIVVDSGSNDLTATIARSRGVQLVQTGWLGFGANKNSGNAAAKHDWILSIDADEELSASAVAAIRTLDLSDPNTVYKFKRINYLNGQRIRFGEWRNDWTIRLFNRRQVHWDAAPVHERLVLPPRCEVRRIHGAIHHYTAPNIQVYNRKLDKYASLVALKYLAKDEKGVRFKLYLSPIYSFFKFYLLHAGWMDRKAGWQIAMAHARYTYNKYRKLASLQQERKAKMQM